MVSLLVNEIEETVEEKVEKRHFFEIDGRDFGDVIEITPVLACPDRDKLAVYFVEVQISDNLRTTVQFPVEPNSELDAWLWMSLQHSVWIWIDPDGSINWEMNNAARMG